MSLKRFCEFFSLLSPWQSGLKSIEVAAAFESPAQNQVARRHGAIAFSALLLGAALLVAAALLNGIPNRQLTFSCCQRRPFTQILSNEDCAVALLMTSGPVLGSTFNRS